MEGLLLRARTGRLTAPWPRAQTLTTRRLVLEPLRPEHARELATVLDDPALHAFIGGEPAGEAELYARYVRQAEGQSPDGTQGWLNWVARDRATRAPVGTVQATISDDGSAELAWVIATSRQGEGLATEAAAAAMAWLRDQLALHPPTRASAAVALHLGLAATRPAHLGRSCGLHSPAARVARPPAPRRCSSTAEPSDWAPRHDRDGSAGLTPQGSDGRRDHRPRRCACRP